MLKVEDSNLRIFIDYIVIGLLVIALVFPAGCASKPKALPKTPLAADVVEPLLKETRKSYAELFEDAPKLRYSSSDVLKMKDYLKKSKEYCVNSYQTRGRQYDQELRQTSGELFRVSGRLAEQERHEQHCRIQNLRILKARADILAKQAIPVAYENREAKLELLQRWPAENRQIQQTLASGTFRSRRWANVDDIGYRVIAEDQEDDIRTGAQAITELRRQGLMPPEVQNTEVDNYVQQLADKLAQHSDLQVPVRVTVLNSTEINAFALPGGFLFIQRGLIEAAENEAELVGVVSHEIAHAAARHGHKLVRKANIANIFLQALQIAGALVGGEALYYALRYGAMGLGLALNLNLLGKSRAFELEADQLGIQYAWHAGYDPRGFSQFFDKMATRKGYVTGASWFRTHPPFYERMVNARKETAYLSQKQEPLVQSDEFKRIQGILKDLPVPREQMPYNRRQAGMNVPIRTEGCPPPEEAKSSEVQYLEEVCRLGQSKED
ncbi:MAG TPA: M48 family metalloprotease, partial [Acidobacteriota bacterium]|nr:M48 family metalloprotease [Acidobacteriota bacterium]